MRAADGFRPFRRQIGRKVKREDGVDAVAVVGEILLPQRFLGQGLFERAVERALIRRPDERPVGNGLPARECRRSRAGVNLNDGGAGDNLAALFANRGFELVWQRARAAERVAIVEVQPEIAQRKERRRFGKKVLADHVDQLFARRKLFQVSSNGFVETVRLFHVDRVFQKPRQQRLRQILRVLQLAFEEQGVLYAVEHVHVAHDLFHLGHNRVDVGYVVRKERFVEIRVILQACTVLQPDPAIRNADRNRVSYERQIDSERAQHRRDDAGILQRANARVKGEPFAFETAHQPAGV
ncbi:hypothetical protein SDC9_121405 [bioreactor metagenome]|uniref:Uncharacterized protein n=1 Tax=bioreactor metagenome TaxID=1076179 RepID=A0A645CBU5_9ZZZZ